MSKRVLVAGLAGVVAMSIGNRHNLPVRGFLSDSSQMVSHSETGPKRPCGKLGGPAWPAQTD